MNESLTPQQAEMLSIFQTHMNAELEGNLEITMETMSENPHLNHVPVMAGGEGRDGVRQFYRNHLVGKFFPTFMWMRYQLPAGITIQDRIQILDQKFELRPVGSTAL